MAELTDNINYLQPTGFKIIMDRKHFGNLVFFATSTNHPSISLQSAVLPYKRSDIHLPGDKLTFGELQFNIIMDENMTAYQEMYDWLEQIVETNKINAADRAANERPTSADITLIALTNKGNTSKKIRYIDAIPTSLGDVQFETVGGDQFIVFPVTFTFSYFELV